MSAAPPVVEPKPGEALTLAHQAELEPLLAARWSANAPAESTLSDPWFANLYLFRAVHGWRLLRGPHPCIAGSAYDGTRLLIPLFDLATAPLEALCALLREGGAFGPLSESQAAQIDPTAFELHSSRDDADYLYPTANFLHYRGALLNKKRNLLKQLLASHEVEAVPYQESLAVEARQVLDEWVDAKHKQPGETDDLACAEALALAGTLGLQGFLYRIGGRPAGFVLAQRIRPGVYVMRFSKGLAGYNGIYQHMFQHFCRATPDARWINFEQDLGLANFRQTKLSYQPASLLTKYRASLRGE